MHVEKRRICATQNSSAFELYGMIAEAAGGSVEASRTFFRSDCIDRCIELFRKEPPILFANPERSTVIMSDLHGDVGTFEKVLINYPLGNYAYAILGDSVDRGTQCTELLAAILACKLLDPENVMVLRGDHELPIGAVCPQSFPKEFYEKLSDDDLLSKLYDDLFPALPVALVIHRHFLVHGGIPKDAPSLEELERLPKIRCAEEDDYVSQMLWKDSTAELGCYNSRRGDGIYVIGRDITGSFLRKNHLDKIVSGHKHYPEGYKMTNKVLTLTTNHTCPGVQRQCIAILRPTGDLEVVDISGSESKKVNCQAKTEQADIARWS
jgi:diadenosine tetraphosphatase ApaH/serine/threonine PP2A family protein phosphatase